MDDFASKVAVVTGAASGLGLGIAQRLLECNASVAFADVERKALDAATTASTPPQRVLAVVTDVSDTASMEALRRQTEETLGPVDLVFNNAGVTPPPTPIVDSAPEVWEWALSVNLLGVVHGIQAFLPGMLQRGSGRIVNTVSLLGLRPTGFVAPYSAAKAGVIAISTALKDEIAGSGVGVSLVFPHVASSISESRRNWPDRLGADPWTGNTRDARSLDMERLTRDYVAGGLDPMEAGAMVLDGVRAGDFRIIAAPDPDAVRTYIREIWPEGPAERP